MPGFVIDVSDVQANIAAFPDGAYEAEIKAAELGIAQSSGQPKINLELEVYHPTYGSAKLYDNLPYKYPAKVKAFWMAINDLSEAQINADPKFEVDPDALVGAQLIINIGTEESYKTPGKMVKTVTQPFYWPITRRDVLDHE